MDRQAILAYAMETYGTAPEYLWDSHPKFAVLRHTNNKKWYALIMNVPKDKLGFDSTQEVDVINLKCEPQMAGSLRMTEGILAGYHMNKENWITVLLDGSVSEKTVCMLLDESYALTLNQKKRKKATGRTS